MRQLAGTLILFFLISCAAASEALDEEGPVTAENAENATVTTIAEVTVEGTASDAADEALKNTKISLAAPYVDVRTLEIADEDGGSTMLEVLTEQGWRALPETFLSYSENDPGCPSIERQLAIREIRVEQGALVVLTASDRGWFDEERSGELELTHARACRELDGEMACGAPTAVDAKLMFEGNAQQTFATKYWVDADGEIETEKPYEDSTFTESAPGT